MALVNFRNETAPVILLVLLLSIIYFFITQIGDPTNKNITNNDHFTVSSAYQITPLVLSLPDVLAAPNTFVTSKIKDVPWSFQQHAYWLKITIANNNNEAQNLVSYFDNPMLDSLSIYQVIDNNKIIKQHLLGDWQQGIAFSNRTTPHFSFKLSSSSQTTLYVRIATTGISNTPVHTYLEQDFWVLQQKVHLLWGIFVGVSIIIALYNLVLYFAVKDSVYLIYNGYILSGLCLMGIVLGYGFYLFPENLQLIFNQQVIAFNCLVAIFALLFLVYFLKFQKLKLWPFKLAMAIIYLLSLLMIVSLWIPEYQSAQLFFLLMPIVYLICFILLITKIRSGLQWGLLYIYSWVPLLIGAAVQPLVLTGKIEYSFFTHHALMIAILLEVVLMAMALADRMRFHKEQVIYQATHDLSSGLPNVTLLETQITKLIQQKKEFASCLIEIENYHTLAPYMPPNELQKLEQGVVKNILPLLDAENKIQVISTIDINKFKLAKIVDGRLMFLIETSNREQLSELLNRLQNKVVRELQLNGLLVELKTNIGICFSVESGYDLTANEFIQHALVAIEQNRESDNHLHYYHDLEVLNIKEHLKLACDLQTAIRENKLHLYHQPQIDLTNGTVYGSEVLLRWHHPEHGFISPELFVRIAEDTGLINELTRWVIDCAFKQLQRLQAHHHTDHKISINISGKDIGLPNFLSFVKQQMLTFKVPSDVIIFELTESVMVTDFAVLDNLMIALNKLGINVSIDDYGTGYSSLNYISQLKFDELKIDKAFILDLDRSERNLTIVKTTIDMANNLNLKVVAEGVESKQIEQKLIDSGCDIGQGYHYTQPLSFDKYLLWLESYNHNKLS